MAIDWTKKLDSNLKKSEAEWKICEQKKVELGKSMTAAKQFIQQHQQFNSRFGQYENGIKDSRVKLAEIAAEASVYDDDLKDAKKAKDKTKMKELEKKLKALESQYEQALASRLEIVNDVKSDFNSLRDTAVSIGTQIGN
jgi:DNA repair ATPase RecN